MKFFHRTTERAWEAIQAEGVLWGIPSGDVARRTYLAPPEVILHDSFGAVLLEVDYEPRGAGADNYGFDPPPGQICWQVTVFMPIPIEAVRRIL